MVPRITVNSVWYCTCVEPKVSKFYILLNIAVQIRFEIGKMLLKTTFCSP
jgi:hypothetical protein